MIEPLDFDHPRRAWSPSPTGGYEIERAWRDEVEARHLRMLWEARQAIRNTSYKATVRTASVGVF